MRDYRIVQFSADEFGVYVRGFRNSFGTPLYFRGSFEDVIAVTRNRIPENTDGFVR